MENYNKIKSVMQDMIVFFDEFLLSLQKKLDVITQGDTETLEQLMKSEQAFSMKIRGLEKNRENALKETGVTAKEFKELMENPTTAEQQETSRVYMKLKKHIQEYTTISDMIKSQIEIKLYSIKIILERLDKTQGQAIYDKNGVDLNKAEDFKSTKI